MSYYEKVKKLRSLSIAQMILGFICFIVWIIMIVVWIGAYNHYWDNNGNLTNSEAGSIALSVVLLYGVTAINSIAMFVIWIIGMVKAFSLENNNSIGGPTKELTAVKVLSVLNGLTFNIGLFVAINSEYHALQSGDNRGTHSSNFSNGTHNIERTEKPVVQLSTEDKIKKLIIF